MSGLFAVKEKYIRQMPGRVAGETLDADGKRGFVLTLSTREQHIRREKATSNICTNSGLCQLAWTIHMTLLGERGLRHLATLNHEKAIALADALDKVSGVEVLTKRYFNEIAVLLKKPAQGIVDALAEKGVIGGVAMSRLNPKARHGQRAHHLRHGNEYRRRYRRLRPSAERGAPMSAVVMDRRRLAGMGQLSRMQRRPARTPAVHSDGAV